MSKRQQENDPIPRELERCVGYVAADWAKLKYYHASIPPHRVIVEIRYDPTITGDSSLSCYSSCQTTAEGPPEEHGNRSHADRVLHLLEQTGQGRYQDHVVLRRIRRKPLKYEVDKIG